MKKVLLSILVAIASLTAHAANPLHVDSIRNSVNQLIERYPLATLADIYKSQFQDRFGPGHIIARSDAAKEYLDEELAQTDEFPGLLYEPTGYRHNFYRVNLRVIADSLVPYDTFFNAFVESAHSVVLPSMEQWKSEWQEILCEVIEMGLDKRLVNFEAERVAIEQRLAAGDYVGHHSAIFENTYHPHYRIISREVFTEKIFPLLKSNNL